MPSKTQTLQLDSWNGGLNTVDDAALVPPNELTVAENIIITNTDAKQSRAGIVYWGHSAVGVTRSSSSTTRTIVVTPAAGEYFEANCLATIWHFGSSGVVSLRNDVYYHAEDVVITSVNWETSYPNVVLTYTATGALTESSCVDTSLRITKVESYNSGTILHSVLHGKDFWYVDTNLKVQKRLTVDIYGNIWSYTSGGLRTPVINSTQESIALTCDIKSNFATADRLKLYTKHTISTGASQDHLVMVWFDKTGADAVPALAQAEATYHRRVRVDISGCTSGTDVATKLAAILNLDNDFSCTNSGADAVIKVRVGGNQTNATEHATGVTAWTITDGTSVAITGPLTEVCSAALENRLMITMSGLSNLPLIYTGSTNSVAAAVNKQYDNSTNASGTFPNLLHIRTHKDGRMYGTLKTDADRIMYSDVSMIQVWNGEGDSGAIDLATGDGDSSGFTSILPSYKGSLFVGKGNQLWRISGDTPLQSATLVSSGVGSVSHNSCIALDESDVIFMSFRGVHSLAVTDQYGDYKASYLSSKIQPNIDALTKTELNRFSGFYYGPWSSFLITHGSKIYLFNIDKKSWYQWILNTTITTCFTLNFGNATEMHFGNSKGVVLVYDANKTKDFINTTFTTKVKTGTIYPQQDLKTIAGFKGSALLLNNSRAEGLNFIATYTIDNFSPQVFTVSRGTSNTAILGTNFILGVSSLGNSQLLLPEIFDLSGYGYGIRIQIEASSPLNIYKYSIEFETAGDQDAVTREE